MDASVVWEAALNANRPSGELAMSAYLDAPTPVPTGVRKLDQLLGGGMTRGVTVIGGPSSAGKSVLACQCAAMMADRGIKVVYASYEMSWEVVQLRCASSWSCHHPEVDTISWSRIVRGEERRSRPEYAGKTRSELSRYLIGSAADPVTRTLTAWDEGPGKNLAVFTDSSPIEELIENMELMSDLKPVLIVDYIQIVPTKSDADEKEYTRVTEVINQLQAYAMSEKGGNVLAISSTRNLTAADYKDGPNMSWFRGSGYIGYAAEQAVMLVSDRVRDADGNMTISRNANGSVNGRLTVVKNKSGASDVSITTVMHGSSNLIT